MTRDEAVARVQVQLGFRRDLVTAIQTQLQDAQAFYERSPILPWFLESEYNETATIPPTNTVPPVYERRVPLPTNFLREMENEPLQVLLTPNTVPSPPLWSSLDKRDDEYLNWWTNQGAESPEWFFNNGTFTPTGAMVFPPALIGPPKMYNISLNYYYLSPFPDQAYTLRQRFYMKDAILASNITNQWLTFAPQLLIGYATRMLAGPMGNQVALQNGSAIEQNALVAMLNEHEWRASTNSTYAMGQDL